MRSKRSNRRRSTKSTKVVRGAKYQSRPSASYHYNTLNNPVGFQVTYRPRKGGKYILHELALRSNGTPYWKALEALPKTKKQNRTRRRSSKRRSSRRRSTRRRSSRRRSTKGKMDDFDLNEIPVPEIKKYPHVQRELDRGDYGGALNIRMNPRHKQADPRSMENLDDIDDNPVDAGSLPESERDILKMDEPRGYTDKQLTDEQQKARGKNRARLRLKAVPSITKTK